MLGFDIGGLLTVLFSRYIAQLWCIQLYKSEWLLVLLIILHRYRYPKFQYILRARYASLSLVNFTIHMADLLTVLRLYRHPTLRV
jgi:hypothetical protein